VRPCMSLMSRMRVIQSISWAVVSASAPSISTTCIDAAFATSRTPHVLPHPVGPHTTTGSCLVCTLVTCVSSFVHTDAFPSVRSERGSVGSSGGEGDGDEDESERVGVGVKVKVGVKVGVRDGIGVRVGVGVNVDTSVITAGGVSDCVGSATGATSVR